MNVRLAADLYSGTSRPDMYRTPHALQSVFGPIGSIRHYGVLSVAQCKHLLPSPPTCTTTALSPLSFFFSVAFAVGVGERAKRREVQLHEAACDRLLRALPGTTISGRKTGLFLGGIRGFQKFCRLVPPCRILAEASEGPRSKMIPQRNSIATRARLPHQAQLNYHTVS
ncbi:hypothetical protein U1Q18_030689 [Sarracenia purpurea var. burkii]